MDLTTNLRVFVTLQCIDAQATGSGGVQTRVAPRTMQAEDVYAFRKAMPRSRQHARRWVKRPDQQASEPSRHVPRATGRRGRLLLHDATGTFTNQIQ